MTEAAHFSVQWKGGFSASRKQTLGEARKAAERLDRANGKKATRIYAIAANGRYMLVPDSFVAA